MRIVELLFTLVEDLIRGLSGPAGIHLRRAWYRHRLGSCGSALVIEPGVHFVGPKHIEVGNSVWIDRNVVLIAAPPRESVRIINDKRSVVGPALGKLRIGDRSHIGIGSIIQAHGGVIIEECFTSSSGVKIYSLSNDPLECRNGTVDILGSNPGYRLTPVEIGRNVWLGLNVSVLGHRIGADTFVMPNSVVSSTIPDNVVASGAPARAVRVRFPQRST